MSSRNIQSDDPLEMMRAFNHDYYRSTNDAEYNDNPFTIGNMYSQLDAPYHQVNANGKQVDIGRQLAAHLHGNVLTVPDFPYTPPLALFDNREMCSDAAEMEHMYRFRSGMLPNNISDGMYQRIYSRQEPLINAKGIDRMLPQISVDINSNQSEVLDSTITLKDRGASQIYFDKDDPRSFVYRHIAENFPDAPILKDYTANIGNIVDNVRPVTANDFLPQQVDDDMRHRPYVNPYDESYNGARGVPSDSIFYQFQQQPISMANADYYSQEYKRTGRSLADINLTADDIMSNERSRVGL